MAVNNYATLAAAVLTSEGGYSDDPRDPGNWTGGKVGKGLLKGTKYGIAANTFPNEDIKNLTLSRARELYKGIYWDAVAGDQLPSGVDYAVFDFAINSGPTRAIIALQRALGLADDGILGPVTLAAAQAADPAVLINRICDGRLAFMQKLKQWPTYKNGWTKRVEGVRATALSMSPPPLSWFARLFGRTAG